MTGIACRSRVSGYAALTRPTTRTLHSKKGRDAQWRVRPFLWMRGSEAAQGVQQRLVLRRRPYADAQELGDARLAEVPHYDALLAQRRRDGRRIAPGMAGEDEVGGRGQH